MPQEWKQEHVGKRFRFLRYPYEGCIFDVIRVEMEPSVNLPRARMSWDGNRECKFYSYDATGFEPVEVDVNKIPAMLDLDKYPDTCPYCGAPSYNGSLFGGIDCSEGCNK